MIALLDQPRCRGLFCLRSRNPRRARGVLALIVARDVLVQRTHAAAVPPCSSHCGASSKYSSLHPCKASAQLACRSFVAHAVAETERVGFHHARLAADPAGSDLPPLRAECR